VLGLLFLHKHGVIHQDIKPANIMVSAAGHAVIGEFGAAATLPLLPLDDASSVSSNVDPKFGPIVREPTDAVTFTSLYAAPELYQTSSDNLLVYNDSVDFWSLGVLLHEVATGELPFDLVAANERSARLGEASGSEKSAISEVYLDDLVKQVRFFFTYRL
jgi:serine/threonine protein kinase